MPSTAPELPPALSGELRFCTRRAGRLGYYVGGPTGAPPMLLVHSVNAAASACEVKPVFDALAGERRIYVPDLPGFGFSDRSDRDYTIRLYCDALRDMLDVMADDGIDAPIDALAVSLGSEFLARVAAESPQRFRSLALVTPTGFSGSSPRYDGPAETSRRVPGMHAVVSLPLWSRALFDLLTRPASIRYFLRRTYGSSAIDEGMAAYDHLTARQPGAQHAPLAFLSAHLFSRDIRNVYEMLSMPIWVPHATRGDFRNFSDAGWAQARANWRFQPMPTGAMPHFERPAEFIADYRRFMASAGAAGMVAGGARMTTHRCLLAVAAVLAALAPVVAQAQAQAPAQAAAATIATREHAVRLVSVVEGLEHPWGLAFLPDGRMLVTERPGRLRVIGADGKLDPAPVAGLPRVHAQGQGGLLDVAAHPRFADNRWVYWVYAQRDASGANGTELARGRLDGGPGAYRMQDVQVLFRMAPKSNGDLHFGARLAFDGAGLLYLTLGDRGEMARAQRLDDHAGKILRLTDEGKPAPGNPFAGQAGAQPEVFSLGHRNVQGAALHPRSGALWAVEHGPQGGDELNLIRAGANYGWPVITYGVNYVTGTRIGEGTARDGMQQPIRHWTPSPALSGLAFYSGDRFPRWRGDLFIGALRGQSLIRVRLDGERAVEDEVLLRGRVARVRDVRAGPDGLLYLLTDHPSGALLRLEPAG